MDQPEVPDPYCDPDNPVSITFDEITSAAYKIKSGINRTECTWSSHLSLETEMEIYIKKEFLQPTGSFKERGARYAMLMMSPEMKSKGLVAASAGNHALACCYHGHKLGIPVTVIMPEIAPLMKVQKCRGYKGNVILQGKNLAESVHIAKIYARDHGMMYLNGYDNPRILAGQGSIGLEIWEQIPGIEAVIVPVGGGGIIAGICVALKTLDSNIKVIGVEPERAASLTAALKQGKPVTVTLGSTIADGLAVAKVGVNSFECVKDILDKCVTVKEQYIALSILKLAEFEKCIVEGAGACALAAVLQNTVPELKGKKVCLILSGGNIDTPVLGRVFDRGLAADGRLVKVKVCISDRVGGMEDLVSTIGQLGVHVRDMVHERAWLTEDVFKVEVKVVCECRDRNHSLELRDVLVKKYGDIHFNGVHFPADDMATPTAIFAPVGANEPALPSYIENDSIQQKVVDLQSVSGQPSTATETLSSIKPASDHPSEIRYAQPLTQSVPLNPTQPTDFSPSSQQNSGFHTGSTMSPPQQQSTHTSSSAHPSNIEQPQSIHVSQIGSTDPSQIKPERQQSTHTAVENPSQTISEHSSKIQPTGSTRNSSQLNSPLQQSTNTAAANPSQAISGPPSNIEQPQSIHVSQIGSTEPSQLNPEQQQSTNTATENPPQTVSEHSSKIQPTGSTRHSSQLNSPLQQSTYSAAANPTESATGPPSYSEQLKSTDLSQIGSIDPSQLNSELQQSTHTAKENPPQTVSEHSSKIETIESPAHSYLLNSSLQQSTNTAAANSSQEISGPPSKIVSETPSHPTKILSAGAINPMSLPDCFCKHRGAPGDYKRTASSSPHPPQQDKRPPQLSSQQPDDSPPQIIAQQIDISTNESKQTGMPSTRDAEVDDMRPFNCCCCRI